MSFFVAPTGPPTLNGILDLNEALNFLQHLFSNQKGLQNRLVWNETGVFQTTPAEHYAWFQALPVAEATTAVAGSASRHAGESYDDTSKGELRLFYESLLPQEQIQYLPPLSSDTVPKLYYITADGNGKKVMYTVELDNTLSKLQKPVVSKKVLEKEANLNTIGWLVKGAGGRRQYKPLVHGAEDLDASPEDIPEFARAAREARNRHVLKRNTDKASKCAKPATESGCGPGYIQVGDCCRAEPGKGKKKESSSSSQKSRRGRGHGSTSVSEARDRARSRSAERSRASIRQTSRERASALRSSQRSKPKVDPGPSRRSRLRGRSRSRSRSSERGARSRSLSQEHNEKRRELIERQQRSSGRSTRRTTSIVL